MKVPGDRKFPFDDGKAASRRIAELLKELARRELARMGKVPAEPGAPYDPQALGPAAVKQRLGAPIDPGPSAGAPEK